MIKKIKTNNGYLGKTTLECIKKIVENNQEKGIKLIRFLKYLHPPGLETTKNAREGDLEFCLTPAELLHSDKLQGEIALLPPGWNIEVDSKLETVNSSLYISRGVILF